LRADVNARLYTNVYNRPVEAGLISCRHCDLLEMLPEVEPGGAACCDRCGAELWHRRDDGLRRTLALSMAAAMLYLVAMAVPMIGLTIVGRQASATVISGGEFLWDAGLQLVSALVFATAVVAPAFQIGFMLAIALGARRDPPRRWVATLLRYLPASRTWSMIEVMLLGVLVALIKIEDYATVLPGIALYMLASLVLLLAAVQVSFDPREVWERIEWASDRSVPAGDFLDEAPE
jgi:paraquat-inducible protein A